MGTLPIQTLSGPRNNRHYREQRLETDVVCDRCTLCYAVFGLFAYCPDCGVHNSLQVLERNLALVEKQLALASSLENDDLRRHLVEDAIENCVSSFDGFARETCRVRAARSNNPEKASDLSFQNLARAAKAISDLFGIDLPAAVGSESWKAAELAFFKRHVIAHRSGIVDDKYKLTSGDATAIVGRRVSITSAEVAAAAATIGSLGAALVRLLPAP